MFIFSLDNEDMKMQPFTYFHKIKIGFWIFTRISLKEKKDRGMNKKSKDKTDLILLKQHVNI